jgi:riboflavin kinase/FMN adenylyltransferase
MQHSETLDQVQLTNSWLTIGTFDGVHLGHQAIIRQMTLDAHQHGASAVVLTFHPHPAVVLGRRSGAFYLTHPTERAAYLEEMGVDRMITLPFDRRVAQMSAAEFIAQVKENLGLRELWVGHDFALGHNREGDLPRLISLGTEYDYRVRVIDEIWMEDIPVSSSRIRAFLRDGDVAHARQLLGRPYQVFGNVIPGDGRGRSIGIPTANLDIWKEKLLPKAGVYICEAMIAEKSFKGVSNIGFRPTFENTPPEARLEVHILDLDRDLYGQEITIRFFARLRDEMRFPNVSALVDQIHHDIQKARAYFAIQPEGHFGTRPPDASA